MGIRTVEVSDVVRGAAADTSALKPKIYSAFEEYASKHFLGNDFLASYPPATAADLAGISQGLDRASRALSSQGAAMEQAIRERLLVAQRADLADIQRMRSTADSMNWYCNVFNNIADIDVTATECANYTTAAACAGGSGPTSGNAECGWDAANRICLPRTMCDGSRCRFPFQVLMRGNINGGPLVAGRVSAMVVPGKPTPCQLRQPVTPAQCKAGSCSMADPSKDGCTFTCAGCGGNPKDVTSVDLVSCYAPNYNTGLHTDPSGKPVCSSPEGAIDNCVTYNTAPIISTSLDVTGKNTPIMWQNSMLRCATRPPLHTSIADCDTGLPRPSGTLPPSWYREGQLRPTPLPTPRP